MSPQQVWERLGCWNLQQGQLCGCAEDSRGVWCASNGGEWQVGSLPCSVPGRQDLTCSCFPASHRCLYPIPECNWIF